MSVYGSQGAEPCLDFLGRSSMGHLPVLVRLN